MVKKLLIVFLVAGVLIGGAVLVASQMLTPALVKSRISNWVEKHTGRQLMIQGRVSFTFYPWIGFKIEEATLTNDPSFGPEPLAEIEEIGVKVKLFSMLQKHLEINKVFVRGLYLNLARDRTGRGNWSSMLETLNGQASGKHPSPLSNHAQPT
ncbi:MAG: AsmA family protein, partial [Magnetococcales bacterium]|nr:AsmA family protein [Magnetococcales bacterium]